MRWIAVGVLFLTAHLTQAQTPSAPQSLTPLPAIPSVQDAQPILDGSLPVQDWTSGERPLFASDRAFPRFIGPISNPVLAKDPRSLTELRALFVNNWFPTSNGGLRGGDAQIYGAQVRVALTDRLTFIADKDGIATLSPKALPARTGFLDIAAGLKYTFIRDVENQFLVTGGFMYEPPTGESKVFQHNGSGVYTVFGVAGKEFAEFWHVLVNGGYQSGFDNHANSSFFYSQVHIDRQFLGWLSPLAEVNWYRYTSGGSHGIPAVLGEGDGLLNFGTSGVAGNNVVTAALGVKARISANLETGIAWETPLGRKDIMLQRLLVEMIFRY